MFKNTTVITKRFGMLTTAAAGLLLVGTAQATVEGPDYSEPQVEASVSVQGTISTLSSETDGQCADLIADGGSPETEVVVGEVCWEFVGDQAKVTYTTEHPWCMSETHLEVATMVGDIPQTKRGNPIPGQFTYGEVPIEPCATEWMTTVDLPEGCTDLVIAAHAVVQATEIDTDAISDLLTDPLTGLPKQGNIGVQFPGGDSYFNSTLSNAGDLDGTYDGWCVDTSRTITPGQTYTCNLYSSYDDLTGIVDKPEGMDNVNCLINQNLVGEPSSSCGGNYTYGDVQRAIWDLIETQQSSSGLGSWSQCRVDELLAIARGEQCTDFVPTCQEKIAIICQPVNSVQVTIAQVTLLELGAPDACVVVREETAWGDGIDFAGNNWATYIETMCPMPSY